MILVLVCAYQATAQTTIGANVSANETSVASRLTYLNASINNERVLLNWAIDNNKETDRFEVERSTDGKTFKMVALVFGSENTGLAEYSFFEKAKKAKSSYRLRIYYKNGRVDYSDTVIP
jgi:hypothetical protein